MLRTAASATTREGGGRGEGSTPQPPWTSAPAAPQPVLPALWAEAPPVTWSVPGLRPTGRWWGSGEGRGPGPPTGKGGPRLTHNEDPQQLRREQQRVPTDCGGGAGHDRAWAAGCARPPLPPWLTPSQRCLQRTAPPTVPPPRLVPTPLVLSSLKCRCSSLLTSSWRANRTVTRWACPVPARR